MNPASDTGLRRKILDTTRTLLLREGYNTLSMRKIARATGYSATSIYLYFENKDALLHALIDEGFERLYAELKTVEAEVEDPVERLERLCRCYVAFALHHPGYYEIMFQLHPEQMTRYPADKYRRARRSLDVYAAALADGVEAGVFDVADPRVSASAVWAMLHGVASLFLSERVDIRIERDVLLETTIAQTIRGCRNGSASDVVCSVDPDSNHRTS